MGTLVSSLSRKLKDAYDITIDDMQELDTIYIVETGGRKYISDISSRQKEILERTGVRLEVK